MQQIQQWLICQDILPIKSRYDPSHIITLILGVRIILPRQESACQGRKRNETNTELFTGWDNIFFKHPFHYRKMQSDLFKIFQRVREGHSWLSKYLPKVSFSSFFIEKSRFYHLRVTYPSTIFCSLRVKMCYLS